MSSVRVPGSLRRPVTSKPAPATAGRLEVSKTSLFTAACLAAASPASIVLAQTAPGQQALPPLSVEAKQAKKKAVPAPTTTSGGAATAAPQPTPEEKSANPYADPAAPYKVDQSASTKLTEPLLDTPKTVTTIPKEVIEDKAATSIRELARQTPGVTLGFGEGGNAFGDRIFIRGFDARNDIYVDGIRDPGNTARETFAVEQIEVYKGPSGVIAGRGTAGGALNIVTKQPNEDHNFFQVSSMFGTDATRRVTVDVNQILTPALTVRGNVLFHEADVAGRDFAHDERWGGFFAATIKPSDAFKVTLDYYRLRSDGIPDFGVPANPVTLVPWTENGLPRNTWYGNAMRDFVKNDADILTATVEAKLAEGVELRSKTRTGENITDYIATGPGQNLTNYGLGVVSLGNPQRYQATDFVVNQTDLTFKFNTAAWKHTLVAGVEVSREETGRYGYTNLNLGVSPTTQPVLSPDPYRGLVNPAWNNTGPKTLTFDATVDTKAAYILDTIKLSEQWFVNGGVRVDNFQKSQVGPTITSTSNASREDTLFNWHAGIVYKPIPIASIYAAYATSANPQGGELDANNPTYGGLNADTAKLAPEENRSVELGTKWELFNRHLLASAAIFQTEKDNARETTPALASTAAYRIRGLELAAQGNITERWSVYGGLVVMETEVTKSAVAENVGKQLANVPTMQFNMLTKYRLTDRLTIGGQAIYANEILGGTVVPNPAGFHTVPFWRFDAMAEYQFTKNVSTQLNVVNLTDETYYDAIYQNANPFVFVAPGRAGYLTINVKY
jgi:catecholate siderophore receptor